MNSIREHIGLLCFFSAILLITGCSLIFKTPESCYEASVYRSVPGNAIHFTNCSTNGETTFWDFGDGTTSTEENPSHVYTEYGTYAVTLVSTLKEEKMDSMVKTVTIGDLILEEIEFVNFFSGAKEPVNFSILDSRGSLVRAPYFILDSDNFVLKMDPQLSLPDSAYSLVFDGQSSDKLETRIPPYSRVGENMILWKTLPLGSSDQGIRLKFKTQ